MYIIIHYYIYVMWLTLLGSALPAVHGAAVTVSESETETECDDYWTCSADVVGCHLGTYDAEGQRVLQVLAQPQHTAITPSIIPLIIHSSPITDVQILTKLNSTRLTLWKVDRVALAPYTLATKSTVSATKSILSATQSTELATVLTATSCQIQVVADLSPVSATVDFVAGVYRTLEIIVF